MRLLILTLLVLSVGCYQKMAVQPAHRPQQPSDFFEDGQSSRPPVPGTVARGQLAMRIDAALYQGKDAKGGWVTEFPFEVTADVMKRGEQRFGVYCVMCHGVAGNGDGRIVQRGFTKPPSYHTDRSRAYELKAKDGEKDKAPLLTDVPVGHIYDVITRGFGAMADYREQIPAHDRWAIVAYVRALQYSQSPGLRERLGKEGKK